MQLREPARAIGVAEVQRVLERRQRARAQREHERLVGDGVAAAHEHAPARDVDAGDRGGHQPEADVRRQFGERDADRRHGAERGRDQQRTQRELELRRDHRDADPDAGVRAQREHELERSDAAAGHDHVGHRTPSPVTRPASSSSPAR